MNGDTLEAVEAEAERAPGVGGGDHRGAIPSPIGV